jgi:hypothetical protein
MKKRTLLIFGICLLVMTACQNAEIVITEEIAAMEENAVVELPAFLASLRQVNDYPFYEAHYIGDYGLEEYMQSGRYPTLETEAVLADAYACSCFYASGASLIFGRNFDWHEHPAMILYTDPPDWYRSITMVDISYLGYDREQTPLKDQSGLLYAPYYPFDGMNEHGLVVGMMAIGHAEGGNDPAKVTVGNLEIIRLLLDRARDVPEALKMIDDYNIDFGSVDVHYMISDAEGNSAIIEYLEGEPVVLESENQWQTSTNFIISEEQPSGADSSCWRYNHLEEELAASDGRIDLKKGMKMLEEVLQEGGHATRWSAVYDLANKNVSVAINREYDTIYQFSFE